MEQLELTETVKNDWSEILVKLQFINAVLDKLLEKNNEKDLSDSSLS